jgi:hypothetical protein
MLTPRGKIGSVIWQQHCAWNFSLHYCPLVQSAAGLQCGGHFLHSRAGVWACPLAFVAEAQDRAEGAGNLGTGEIDSDVSIPYSVVLDLVPVWLSVPLRGPNAAAIHLILRRNM